jgi:uncharacterized protein (DUF983 family)
MSYSKIIGKSLRLKCPACGSGKIFHSYLKIKPADKCDSCGLDLTKFNVGDAPAYFSIFTVGILVPVLAILVEIYFEPSFLIHAILWIPITILFCYLTLIFIRSIFIHIEHNFKKPE